MLLIQFMESSSKCKPIYNNTKQINVCVGMEVWRHGLQICTKKLFVVMDMFFVLIVVIVYTYGKTHHIVHVKYVQFILHHLNLNKANFKKLEIVHFSYISWRSMCRNGIFSLNV